MTPATEQVHERGLEGGDRLLHRAGTRSHLQRRAGEETPAAKGAVLQVLEERIADRQELANAELAGTVQLWEWIGDQGATTFSY